MTKPDIIQFPKHLDPTGTLIVADQDYLPFIPQRVFWMTGLRLERGGHALKTCEQIIVCLRGNFHCEVYQRPRQPKVWRMKLVNHGLYIPKMCWRNLRNFTTDAIALVIASEPYDPDDYIHNYSEFIREIS